MADILVVGKRDSVLGFRTIGLETLFWQDDESVKHLANYINEGSKIIFVTEEVFGIISEFMDGYFGQMYPVFVPIPDISGSKGIGYENIRKLVIRALGTDIFGDE